jgi:hypothetical protein
MVALANQEAVPMRVIRYFEGEKPSLKQHFLVLEEMEVPRLEDASYTTRQ